MSNIKKSGSEALKVGYFLEYLTKYPTFRASDSKSRIRNLENLQSVNGLNGRQHSFLIVGLFSFKLRVDT